jgi:3-keto-5-aminohexanoate cleavage enzyme
MNHKLMITAALVGAEVTRHDTPYLPITPDEIADEALLAYQAGACIAHIHARNETGESTQDAQIYQKTIEKIKDRCDIIVQVSTGGAVGMSREERIQPVRLSPEMATLTTGTVNFGSGVFLNSQEDMDFFASEMTRNGVVPEFEIFDSGMIANANGLINNYAFKGRPHFDLVLGVPGAMTATAKNLLHLVEQLPTNSTWTVAGIGRHQLPMAMMAMAMGGHVRVGFEDNIYYSRGVLAKSNAQLVERAARLARELDREPAKPSEARKLLGIYT